MQESARRGRDPLCRNCGAPATDAYCPHCGQATRSPRRAVGSLIADALNTWFGVESKLWPTLRVLFTQPGALTEAFRQDRRAAYTSPVRLFLAFSIVTLVVTDLQALLGGSAAASRHEVTVEIPRAEDGSITFGFPEDTWLARRFNPSLHRQFERWETLAERGELGPAFRERLRDHLAVMMLCFLPVLALVLRLLWAGSGLLFVDHFVFALHFTSFLQAWAWVAILPSGWPDGVRLALFLVVPWYFYRAQRRLLAGSRRRTLATTLLVFVASPFLILPYFVLWAVGLALTL